MLSLWGRWWVFLFPDLWVKRPCAWESPISILTWCRDWWDYEHPWRGNHFAYGKDALNAGSDRLKIKALKSHTSQYSEPYMVLSHVCFAQKTNNKFNAHRSLVSTWVYWGLLLWTLSHVRSLGSPAREGGRMKCWSAAQLLTWGKHWDHAASVQPQKMAAGWVAPGQASRRITQVNAAFSGRI